MSRRMGFIPTYVGTPSFHRNLALHSLEHLEDVPPAPSPLDGPAEAVKEIVVELNIEPEPELAGDLTPFARGYFTRRYGTLDLDPMPSACDEDPYNWPQGKKITVLFLVSFHCMVATLTMTALIPAYSQLADKYGKTVHDSTYLTLVQIIVLGVAPLTWGPLATVYGRRPVFLVSLFMALIGNVACAVSPNYGALMFFRAFVAFFLSPANILSGTVVTDIFFRTERARGVGLCALMFSLGVPFGPLIFGFVGPRAGLRWDFWVLVVVNGVQLIAHFFLGPETLFIRNLNMAEAAMEEKPKSFKAKFLTFTRVGSKPLSKVDFLDPLALAASPCAILPCIAQSVVFLFGSIFLVVEIPLQLGEKFHLNHDGISLQFFGMVIGLMLAQPVGGLLSDIGMKLRRSTRDGDVAPPEFRLWLSYAGFCLLLTGIPLFLVSTENAEAGRWTVVPVVGTAIAAGGHHITMTTLATYAVDCNLDEAVNVDIFSSLLRQIVAFVGPLWFPTMIRTAGLKWSSSIVYAIVILLGMFPTILIHTKGKHWR